jgi:hypothetical protein
MYASTQIPKLPWSAALRRRPKGSSASWRAIGILAYISEVAIVLCILSKERLCSARRRASRRGKAFPFFTLIRDDNPSRKGYIPKNPMSPIEGAGSEPE